MPPSKGPFSANIHPITPKLSVPIPEGMCFRKMVGGPLRKWTDRGQKSTSNHHKDSSRLLTNPLKVNLPEVISPRICIWSFQLCCAYSCKVGNDQMHIRGEMTSGRLTLSGFVRSRLESLWWFEVDFWPRSVHFRRGPPTIFRKHMPSGMGTESLGVIGCIFAENGPLEGGIEASFWGTGWGAKGDFRRIFGPDPFIFEGGPPPFFESTCPQVWAQKVWEWLDVYSRRMGP